MDISKILTFSDLGMSIKIYLFNIRPFSQSKGSVTTKYPSKHTTILTGHKTLLRKDYIGMLKWVLDEMSQIKRKKNATLTKISGRRIYYLQEQLEVYYVYGDCHYGWSLNCRVVSKHQNVLDIIMSTDCVGDFGASGILTENV